jgi:hypothetical protein
VNLQQWRELIHGLPCVVCFLQTGEKRFGVHGHHLESVRDNLSDWLMVPLCPEHHDPNYPNSIHALHRRGFYTRYKLDDMALIGCTIKLAMQSNARPEYGEIAIRDAMIEGLVRSKVEESKT